MPERPSFGTRQAELRRSDVDVTNAVVHVRRGVVRTNSGRLVKGRKYEAGKRPVAIPPHLMPAVQDHLRDHAAAGRSGLLFPAGHGEQLARPRCTGCITQPVRRPDGLIFDSTICGTPAPPWPRPPVPRWPS